MTTDTEQKQPTTYFTGIVKQVLDGGAVVIRGQPRNGPPPERTLALAEIEAPRLARRPGAPGAETNRATPDEPYAWESREFLRKLLVGKSVLCCVSYATSSGREYGKVLYGSQDPDQAENAAHKLVSLGLAKVRDNCQDSSLKDAQDQAKSAQLGIHSGDNSHIRRISWEQESPRQLVEQMAGKPMSAVVEHVRDGSTVRLFVVDDQQQFYHLTMMMSGVRCPSVLDAQPFAQEAHYFTESRLLQRDVKVVLESVNNKNYVGSVMHPNGNIAEGLLREGFAKCVDWSLKCVTGGPEKYRAAQNAAKERRLRVWKDHVAAPAMQLSEKDKNFTGKVVEVVNGDAIMVKRAKNDTRKIFLASIRPPRLQEGQERKQGFRPLYDIPYMFEAREFLRKKLINQNVHVTVDYVQPANNDFPEKTQATVTIGGVNVAEALVAKGYATVVRYSADNDQRSSHYDDLLAAEDKAIKSVKGVHDKKNIPSRRIADLSGDVAKSKQFLPFLQRAGKMQCVVEFVASGSRFRVYIPRETCVITFLLAGVQCPRATRTMKSETTKGEPFGDEAHAFVKEMVLQREVEIEVESMDKGGNFIGWMNVDNSNVSTQLVEEGFAQSWGINNSTSIYARQIAAAEDNAKRDKRRRWANYDAEKEAQAREDARNEAEAESKEDNADRKVKHEKVVVTEVTQEGKFFAQHVEEGHKLEALMKEIRAEFTANPPLAGAYQPKRGDLCAAKFVDDEWYRAKVEKVQGQEVHVLYVDYGNRANVAKTRVGALPSSFTALQPFAKEYSLALCTLPTDEDYAGQSLNALKEDLLDRTVNLNVEYRVTGAPFVSLTDVDNAQTDFGKNLVADGLMLVDRKGGRRLAKMLSAYTEAQDKAKKEHLNIWEYGDITADDAREFGAR